MSRWLARTAERHVGFGLLIIWFYLTWAWMESRARMMRGGER